MNVGKSDIQQMVAQVQTQEDEIDLRIYLAVLLESKWLIVLITTVACLCGVLFAWQVKPLYKVDVLLQIEGDNKGSFSGLEDISSLMLASSPATPAEIEIIQSRKILGAVVEGLRLDIQAEPMYFPVFGEAISRSFQVQDLQKFSKPWFNLSKYAWGGEAIQVDTLEVSPIFLDQGLDLVYLGLGKYVVKDLDGNVLIDGVVGKLTKNATLKIFVSKLNGRDGTFFRLVKLSKSEATVRLKEMLAVTEKQKSTGLLSIVVQGYSPTSLVKISDEIANTYLRQSVERKSEEAKNALKFLQKQLPDVKAKLMISQQKLNDYRQKRGSVNLPLETQSLLTQSVDIERQLSSLAIEREELRHKFTDNHPLIKSLDSKRTQFLLDKSQLERSVKKLPETEREVLRLTQNAQVSNEIYMFLLNKTQELQVIKAGIIGNVYIIDYAEFPRESFKPRKGVIILVALLVGFFLGVLFSFVRHLMNSTIEDPDIIEQKFGLAVFASLPHSDVQEKLSRDLKNKNNRNNAEHYVLAKKFPDDLFVEALRSLRTNLHFALLEAKNNIVMLTGPAPSLGKSFVSINFAQVIADSGKSVLLIDGDLRKGHLQKYFGIERRLGLSDVLTTTVDVSEAIQEEGGGLWLLSNGTIPPNPAELLMHENFEAMMQEVSKQFDVVIIDTPPVLAVTDAVIIGKYVGTTFMLLRSGQHQEREVQQTIDYLNRVDIKINGVIFNDVYFKGSSYGYGGYRYQYSYK